MHWRKADGAGLMDHLCNKGIVIMPKCSFSFFFYATSGGKESIKDSRVGPEAM